MPATKERTYNEAEIAEKLKALPGWYYEDGWIRRVYKTDGWPTTLHAGERDRLSAPRRRTTIPIYGHLGPDHREAAEPRGRRDHRQGLRAGAEDRGGRALAAAGRRARGHAEQVGAVGGSHDKPRRVLFVTGKLAEPALRRVLAEMQPPFEAEVAVLGITVAALMTTPWIARFLEVPPETDLVLIPGLCEGDTAVVQRAGSACGSRKGPKDLREIPATSAAAAAARTTAPTPSRSWPRSTTRPSCPARRSARPRTTSARAAPTSSTSAAPRGSPFPRSATSCASCARAGHAGQHRQLRSGRDPDRGGGRRGAGAERQRLQPRGGAGARRGPARGSS